MLPFADDDGIHVRSVGAPSMRYSSSYSGGLEAEGASGYGPYVGRADLSGVYVDSASRDGQVTLMQAGDAHAPGAIVGAAIEPLDTARGSGLIWVLVQPR